MKLSLTQTNTALLATSLLLGTTTAFAPAAHTARSTTAAFGGRSAVPAFRAAAAPLMAAGSTTANVDDEVTRLRNMAAKLRGEVAALEDEQRAAIQEAAASAFRRLDLNGDGIIDVDELRTGLAKFFKKPDLPAERVQQLMQTLDTSGDGVLQVDEMRTLEQLGVAWQALERQEKQLERDQAREAQAAKQAAELEQAALALLNDGAPTTSDKIISTLPYLFPLLDGLQFIAPWAIQHADNPVAQAAAVAYGLYRSIPFGGFLAFFALSTLSGNLGLNRLVRFNMLQAMYLDVAMFVPTLAITLLNLAGSATGVGALPESVTALTGEALFAVLALNILYSTASSTLLGQAPDKIPFISKAVNDRLPNVDDVLNAMNNGFNNNQQDDDKKQ